MQKDPEQNKEDKLLWERYRDNTGRADRAPCPDANSLAAYLEGNASGRTVRKIEEHLAGCPDCPAALGELRSLLNLPAREVPARVTEREKELVPPRRRPAEILPLFGIYWRRAAGWAVAAACVVAAGATGMELGSRAVIDRRQLAAAAELLPLSGTGFFDLNPDYSSRIRDE